MKSTNLDLLLEEHNLGEQVGEKYFSYMYSIIQFTFVFYGGLITVLSSKFRVIETYRETIVYIIVFVYSLPIVTYILGLFYAYNSVAISRQGYYMIITEGQIRKFVKRKRFGFKYCGWNILSKNVKSGFILPYGTMLMFYFILPVATYFCNIYLVDYSHIEKYLIPSVLFIIIIPVFLLYIYIIFMCILIKAMLNIEKLYKTELDKINAEYMYPEETK